jgi:hypothetical protein
MPMTPLHDEQLTDKSAPLSCRSKNCVCCCFVMAAYRVSCGRFHFTATAVRGEAGVSCFSGTGGLGYLAGCTAISEMTNGAVKGTVRYVSPAEALAFLRAGSPTIWSIDYSPLLGTRYACEDDFGGGHGMYVNNIRGTGDATELQVGDPLADGRRTAYHKGFIWMPAKLLVKAATVRTGTYGTSSPRLNIVTFRDTEGTWRKARQAAVVRKEPDSTSPKVGKTVIGKDYWVERTVTGQRWSDPTTGRTGVGWHDIGPGFVRGPALV